MAIPRLWSPTVALVVLSLAASAQPQSATDRTQGAGVMETSCIAEMLPHEIIARLNKAPVAFVALGTLEWHGEHLALGTDGLKAQRLCELAAAGSGGFAFPTIWAGEPQLRRFGKVSPAGEQGRRLTERLTRNLERLADGPYGTTDQQQIEAYRQMVYRRLVELNTMGIKAVCLVSGHYPLEARVSDVVEEFNKRFKETKAFVGREYHYAGGGPNVGGDHAGKWETSYMWYLWPGCVDLSVYRGRQAEPLIGVMGWVRTLAWKLHWPWGARPAT